MFDPKWSFTFSAEKHGFQVKYPKWVFYSKMLLKLQPPSLHSSHSSSPAQHAPVPAHRAATPPSARAASFRDHPCQADSLWLSRTQLETGFDRKHSGFFTTVETGFDRKHSHKKKKKQTLMFQVFSKTRLKTNFGISLPFPFQTESWWSILLSTTEKFVFCQPQFTSIHGKNVNVLCTYHMFWLCSGKVCWAMLV